MLACARIGAVHSVIFGGFSATALVDRIADAKSKILITADGGYRRGKVVPLKETADAALKNCPTIEKSIVVKRTGEPSRLAGRPRSLVARSGESRVQRLPRFAARFRASALHPLHQRHHGKTQGRAAHLGRLPAASDLDHPARLRSEGRRRLLVHRRHRLGHRTQLHRLRPAANGASVVMYEGAPDQSAQGPLLGNRRALQGHDLLQLGDGGARVHGLGNGMDRQARHFAACGFSARSASRSIPPHGSGISRPSARTAAPSSTPGGKPKPAR